MAGAPFGEASGSAFLRFQHRARKSTRNGHIRAETRLQIGNANISVPGGSSDAIRSNGSVGSIRIRATTQTPRSEAVRGRASGRTKNKIQAPSNEAAKMPAEKEMCVTGFTPNVKVSDRSQPPLMSAVSLSEPAGSGSLHRSCWKSAPRLFRSRTPDD
jgi:hypothetical protein